MVTGGQIQKLFTVQRWTYSNIHYQVRLGKSNDQPSLYTVGHYLIQEIILWSWDIPLATGVPLSVLYSQLVNYCISCFLWQFFLSSLTSISCVTLRLLKSSLYWLSPLVILSKLMVLNPIYMLITPNFHLLSSLLSLYPHVKLFTLHRKKNLIVETSLLQVRAIVGDLGSVLKHPHWLDHNQL